MLTHKLESKITTNTHEDGTIELELDDVVRAFQCVLPKQPFQLTPLPALLS